MGGEIEQTTRKRKLMGHKKNSKSKKNKMNMRRGDVMKPKKIDKRLQKVLRKKARDYNSDTDEDNEDKDEEHANSSEEDEDEHEKEESFDDDDDDDDGGDMDEVSEDEGGEIQPGITKFKEGCNAFRVAFMKIIRKAAADDVLGPVLSAHKKLVAEKLAEEEVERKAKGEAKKVKLLVEEKGHVKPDKYLDSHEKHLISIATKGVVKLFNAVNKAQHAQKGLNPSRAKDEKVIKKRRKEAFFSELGKSSSQSTGKGMQAGTSTEAKNGERPGWAPLRDDFMLTSSKLKDWDKKLAATNEDDSRMQSETDSSSDDD